MQISFDGIKLGGCCCWKGWIWYLEFKTLTQPITTYTKPCDTISQFKINENEDTDIFVWGALFEQLFV